MAEWIVDSYFNGVGSIEPDGGHEEHFREGGVPLNVGVVGTNEVDVRVWGGVSTVGEGLVERWE